MNQEQLTTIVNELIKLPKECEYVEFKLGFHSNERIGEIISAISNSCCLLHRQQGYLVFGIDDARQIVGTTFNPTLHKKENEEFEHWLVQRLTPRIDFRIYEFDIADQHLALFEIPSAINQPIDFMHEAYVRVGSVTRKLREFPEKESKIWNSKMEFETSLAIENLSAEEVVELLDTQSFFDHLKIPYPTNRDYVLNRLSSEKLVVEKNYQYAITNLGAIMFAKDLRRFDKLSNKSPRVLIYKGKDKLETLKDLQGSKGYAVAFEGQVKYINDLLPSNEAIESAVRKTVRVYPELAIRELVANAMIHQDFLLSGTGPLIEIFSDRIEFTNPGTPLITTNRFIDEYQSRNEKIAAMMRRFGFCEEKGSGIDKVVAQCEVYQLPAPEFSEKEKHTTVVLFAPMLLSRMDRKDKIRACYQHCCLKYVARDRMTNQSLRARFKIDDKNAAIASRIIMQTIDDKLIKDEDPLSKSKKFARYIPYWA
jgi:ATP-dependent DNA helicase RecG